jgi:hypothetical protein
MRQKNLLRTLNWREFLPIAHLQGKEIAGEKIFCSTLNFAAALP